jgi:hypothetical protein
VAVVERGQEFAVTAVAAQGDFVLAQHFQSPQAPHTLLRLVLAGLERQALPQTEMILFLALSHQLAAGLVATLTPPPHKSMEATAGLVEGAGLLQPPELAIPLQLVLAKAATAALE